MWWYFKIHILCYGQVLTTLAWVNFEIHSVHSWKSVREVGAWGKEPKIGVQGNVFSLLQKCSEGYLGI